jgi:dihydroneopterin aldolase
MTDRVERDRIELRGLRAVGAHGALPEERHRPQPFEVDIDIEADLRAAGQSDLLGDTVDYGAVTRVVMGVVAGEHAELLEYLAERIAAAVLDVAAPIGPEVKVTVSVRKVRPPVPVDMASAGVRITRP